MPRSYYDRLTDSQRKAVFHTSGPLLVLAGPGSGKTRVITTRIAALIDAGIRPHNICAITFTNKAAEEMRQRVTDMATAPGTHISTFHSLCVRILRQYARCAGVKSNFSIYGTDEQARCIKQAVKDCQLDTRNFPPARMLAAVSALKNNLVDVALFKAEADDFFSKTLAKIYAAYQQLLRQRNALDFDDLLMKTCLLLEASPETARQLANRFRYLLVDEYQDTNHAQYKIAKSIAAGHRNICVTGDPDQSIYRWRGADIRNILAFEKDWPDATVVKLEENFRSTPNILQLAENLIAKNQKRKPKRLIPTKPPGRDVAIDAFEDELEEANGVAGRIRQLHDSGASWDAIAVFYRINAESRAMEEAFVRQKIPYQILRGVEFYSRKEIRNILAYAKIIVNPDDEVALLRIINTPARGIGKTTINRLRHYAASKNIPFYQALRSAEGINSLSKAPKTGITTFLKMIETLKPDAEGPVAALIQRIFTESGLEQSLKNAGPEAVSARENVEELINAAARYDQQTEQPSLLDYLQQISLFSDTDTYDSSSGRVALMTLHAAKGLEFDNVFIVGVEDGLLPHERSSDNEDQTEEERRLFFVGITRAISTLSISYARYRTIRGQLLRTIPSPFLFELGIDIEEHESRLDTCDEEPGPRLATDTAAFVKNQRVRHKKFGLGTVKNFADMGPDSIIAVKFDTGQTKSLMVRYAGLAKVSSARAGNSD